MAQHLPVENKLKKKNLHKTNRTRKTLEKKGRESTRAGGEIFSALLTSCDMCIFTSGTRRGPSKAGDQITPTIYTEER